HNAAPEPLFIDPTPQEVPVDHTDPMALLQGADDVQELDIHLIDAANPHADAIQQSPTSTDSANHPVSGEFNNTEPSSPQSPKSPSIDASEEPDIDTPGAHHSTLP
ncbi:hypothetical protein CPB97_005869, partial [Podila verticillata]